MFPIKDDNPNVLIPYATYSIVAINILSWFFVQGLGSEPHLSRSLCQLGLIPGELLNLVPPNSTIQLGANALCKVTDSGNWLSVISHMFLHGGWMHLISNMWFLWIFGNNVEDSMGHIRFVFFYFLCGLAAATIQSMTNPSSIIPMVGASGAIGGVMGAYVLLYPRVKVHLLIWLGFFVTTFAVPAFWMLGYWFLIQLLGGFSSFGRSGGGVAFWAHIGGFVTGGLLIFLFKDAKLVERHPYYGWK